MRSQATYGALFEPEVYGSIVGLFELNNLCLVSDPVVENYFLHIDELPSAEKKAAQLITGPLLDALHTDYSLPCEGTAYYPLQACVNHSCAPNAHAMKRESDVTGSAVLLALRPLSVGEEVTISYVDEGMRLSARRAELRDYGKPQALCQRTVVSTPDGHRTATTSVYAAGLLTGLRHARDHEAVMLRSCRTQHWTTSGASPRE
jgi:hypothetical protein